MKNESAVRASGEPQPERMADGDEILQRANSYLGNGGFCNPEMMEHEKVRDLILDMRNYLVALRSAVAPRTAPQVTRRTRPDFFVDSEEAESVAPRTAEPQPDIFKSEPPESLDPSCHCGYTPEGSPVFGVGCPNIAHRARSGKQWRDAYIEEFRSLSASPRTATAPSAEPGEHVCKAHGIDWCEVCLTDEAFNARRRRRSPVSPLPAQDATKERTEETKD